jgi:hypothetical protein
MKIKSIFFMFRFSVRFILLLFLKMKMIKIKIVNRLFKKFSVFYLEKYFLLTHFFSLIIFFSNKQNSKTSHVSELCQA